MFTQLGKGLFTVGALDNIDHNPSSTTYQDSFHGTGMNISNSLLYPNKEFVGIS